MHGPGSNLRGGHEGDFRAVLQHNGGGDINTVGAITGALIGTHELAIPSNGAYISTAAILWRWSRWTGWQSTMDFRAKQEASNTFWPGDLCGTCYFDRGLAIDYADAWLA